MPLQCEGLGRGRLVVQSFRLGLYDQGCPEGRCVQPLGRHCVRAKRVLQGDRELRQGDLDRRFGQGLCALPARRDARAGRQVRPQGRVADRYHRGRRQRVRRRRDVRAGTHLCTPRAVQRRRERAQEAGRRLPAVALLRQRAVRVGADLPESGQRCRGVALL